MFNYREVDTKKWPVIQRWAPKMSNYTEVGTKYHQCYRGGHQKCPIIQRWAPKMSNYTEVGTKNFQLYRGGHQKKVIFVRALNVLSKERLR